jgi:hypothetical protein
MLAHLMGCGWSSELVRSAAGASLVLDPADPALPAPDYNGNLQLLANNGARDSDWSVNEPGPRFCFSARAVGDVFNEKWPVLLPDRPFVFRVN